ncbi:hypothetical protein FOTG_17061 [Fusarium oxysporum f. sp. vasinfectum 25433]|uniref:Uncharacterized protein n=1 Tax=Fusarium oxysporum f. sp. vasinfectum 25433 TaxID=1089449 RepID=X0L0F8_FUSOX|nr:hypothetical protein FOTG_17061 [Fusarium oxysporum f. sp. vasinfectum 25433]
MAAMEVVQIWCLCSMTTRFLCLFFPVTGRQQRILVKWSQKTALYRTVLLILSLELPRARTTTSMIGLRMRFLASFWMLEGPFSLVQYLRKEQSLKTANL